MFLDPDGSNLFFLFIVFLFSCLSAFISASESAFKGLSQRKIDELLASGSSSARNLDYLFKKPENLVITLVLGNIICYSAIVSSFALLFYENLPTYKNLFSSIIISSLFIFIFTSLLPKAYITKDMEKMALRLAFPIRIMSLFFYPVVFILNVIAKPLIIPIKGSFENITQQMTEKEFKDIVEMGKESGVLEKHETKIIHSALTFDQLTVNSILTPRVDIVCVTVDTTISETLDLMLSEEYTRMPVYEENIDNIVGVVHIKDIVRAIRQDQNNLERTVKNVIRDVYHVPENQTVGEVLKEMQAKGVQIAIVCDEFGGTTGLITMEDILEEIVGEIRDEHDSDETPMIHEINRDMILVDAKVGVGEINRIFNVNLPDNQTVGRLIFEMSGEVPSLEQNVRIGNIELTIKEVDGIRIQKIMVTRHQESESEIEENLTEKSEIY